MKLLSLTEMSVAGAVMILAITVIRAVLINRLPKRTFVALWEIAMLRLLLPFSVPFAMSVYTLLPQETALPVQTEYVRIIQAPEVISLPEAAAFRPENKTSAETISPQEAPSLKKSLPVWETARIAGTAISALAFIFMYLAALRRFRFSSSVTEGFAADWLKEHKLRRKVTVRVSGKISSPLTYGIFRPVIMLPAGLDMNDSGQLSFILAHELTHIKRFDMARKLAAAAVLCLHWYSPAVWVMYLLFNRDIELACDEAVLRSHGGDCRSAYALALIAMEERQGGFGSLYNSFSRNAAEERIVAIMKTKKLGVTAAALSFAVVIGMTCIFATSSAESPEKDSPSVSDTNETAADISDELSFYGVPQDGYTPAPPRPAKTSSHKVMTMEEKRVAAAKELISKYIVIGDGYEQFGLTKIETVTDGERVAEMYYDGEKVRYFCDFIITDDRTILTVFQHYSEDGVIDLYAERKPLNDADKGELTGFRKADKSQFDMITFYGKDVPVSILAPILEYVPIEEYYDTDIIELTGWVPATEEELLERYGQYGIYFENGVMMFEGEAIRYFCDWIDSGSEECTYDILYSQYQENGVIDVYFEYGVNEIPIGARRARDDEFTVMSKLFDDVQGKVGMQSIITTES